MFPSRTTTLNLARHKQHGAALMVMLVIMTMGTAAFLVSALNSSGLRIEQNKNSSQILARTKEVVMGKMLAGGGGQRPGDLPYPDRLIEATPNYDGNTDSCPALQIAPTPTGCLGRLPWRSPLHLPMTSPSENDPTGFMPWYAVSANLVDPVGVIFNSELLNSAPHTWLTVRDTNGNVLSNRVAFVVIVPGTAINGQSRPSSPNLGGSNQYLDSIIVPNTCTIPCIAGTYSNADTDDEFIMGENPIYSFNDKLIYVTIDELMPLIEKRIAREVKNCLDDYAITSAEKYPWATPISDLAYATTQATYFGRIPATPTVMITNPTLTTLLNNIQATLNNLQSAETACQSSDNSANTTALTNAANALLTATSNMTVPPFPSSSQLTSLTSYANAAALAAKPTSSGGSSYSDPCNYIENGHNNSLVQTKLDSANSVLPSISDTESEDLTMQPTWPASCTLFTSTYWDEWKSLVFYQLSDGYKPDTAIPSCGSDCLSINGSGNPNSGSGTYRAAISIAGKKLGGQTRAIQSVDQYLELNNQNNKSAIPTNLTFDTYKSADANYSSVNDLVLCLDGKNNCK